MCLWSGALTRFSEHAKYLLVALLPEDAAILNDYE
jgi:hypothetical protein